MVDENYLPSKKVGDFFKKNVIFLHYPTSHSDNPRVEEMFDVSGHPTFLFINHKGELLSKSVGASEVEDEFIEDMAFCLKEENYIKNKAKAYSKGKVTPKEYYKYTEKMNLRSEMSIALNDMFIESVKNNTINDFMTSYLKFRPMIYFDLVDSELYNYLLNNKESIIAGGANKDEYKRIIYNIPSNSIEKILTSRKYSKGEFKALSDIVSTSDDKVYKIQLEAIKRCKKEGLEGIINEYSKSVDKLNDGELFNLNLFIIRNYSYSAKSTPYLKEYLINCMENSSERGKLTYKRMIE